MDLITLAATFTLSVGAGLAGTYTILSALLLLMMRERASMELRVQGVSLPSGLR
jgi:hypothetical protein